MIMKSFLTYSLLISLLTAGMMACSTDDDAIKPTGENGKPSQMKYSLDNTGLLFYYQADRLWQTKSESGGVTEFIYKNDELASLHFYQTNEMIADGGGSISFKKEGDRKILVEHTAEPFFDIYTQEIELDERNLPVKITQTGSFAGGFPPGEERQLLQAGRNYSLFSYDASTLSLLKEEVFLIENDKRIGVYTYEYENTPGVIGRMNAPLWFYIYRSSNTYTPGIYLHYARNLSKATININVDENQWHETFDYSYEYNKAGYPVTITVTDQSSGERNVQTIRY
jgi:hypothetical protein